MLLGKIFGSKKVIETGAQLIDNAFHTDQEKAEEGLARMSLKVALLKAYEPFRVAQRFLAIIFSVPYVSAWLTAFTMSCFGLDVSAQERLLDGTIKDVVWTIVAFYFFGGAAEGTVRGISAYKKMRDKK